MNATGNSIATPPCFQLKGGLFTLTALQLLHTDLALFAEQLLRKLQEAPNFFKHAPIVLDLTRLHAKDTSLNLEAVAALLRQHNLIPIGIRGGSTQHQERATAAGLAVLPDSKTQAEQPTTTPTQPVPPTAGKVVTQPVRSGQQIYARGGDLVVCAPVSPGAELLADGHIHVYGPLRGRALAGVLGNTEAYIFCQSLEAELVSIAGQYRISENLKDSLWKSTARISLQAGHLQIESL